MAYSSNTLFSLINDLHPGSTAWAVRARVIRLYKQPSYLNKQVIGSVEMVVHDQEGVRIHVSMRPDIYKKFKDVLSEGSLYIIKHFFVNENQGNVKTTSHNHKLGFFRDSVIKKYEDDHFPSFMFNITQLDQLQIDQEFDATVLKDVIGRVISYQKPFEGSNAKKMDFRIQDTENNQIACSLWEDYIQDLLPILETTKDKPVIVAIQFGRAIKLSNGVKISSGYHVTKVTVNAESDVFKDFMTRLNLRDNAESNKMLSNTDYSIYEEFTTGRAKVKKIAYLNDDKNDAFCWVDATIVDIEPTGQYWYAACKNCAKKLVTHPGTSTCVGCGQDNSVKTIRFKVEVMVVDKTGTATLLLWNTACELLTGKSAAELYSIYGEYSDQIPKELEDGLIKKRGLFELRLSTFKIVRGVFNCAVTRCAYDDEIMETYTKLFNVTQGSTSDEHGTLTENSNSSPDDMDKNVKRNDKGKRKLFIDEDDEEDDEEDDAVHAADGQEKCTEVHEVSAADLGNNAAGKTTNAAEKSSDAASAISPSDAVYKSKRRLIKKEK